MDARPYAPSWLDVVTGAVRRLPVPAAIVYAVVGLALSLLRTIVGWVDGSYPVGTVLPVHILDGLIPLYFLAVVHYLDDLADRALADYRAKLSGSATTYDELRYRLTTMPAALTLVLAIFGFAAGLAYIQLFLSPVDIALSHYFTSPTAVVVDTIFSGLSGLMMTMFAWHTVWQLRMISRIYTRHTRVSIFDIGPLYALSRVTAVTTVSLLVFSYVYIAVYTEWQINSVSNGVILVALLVVALLTFVVPLWGAHRLLQTEKAHRQSEVGRRIEAAADAVHAHTDRAEFTDEIDHLDSALGALLKERDVVAKASTWPWEPEALRAVFTALLLPVVIWLVTRVLERLGV
jgi:ABC-type multidrug transport system fused ATPase/permease subunit